ncbi:hypothetical protein LTR95_003335 [Oleoguttula sp. CCFEE 5521]
MVHALLPETARAFDGLGERNRPSNLGRQKGSCADFSSIRRTTAMPFAPLLLFALLFRFRIAIVLTATYARVLAATCHATDPEYYDMVANLCTIMLLGLASGRFADSTFPHRLADRYMDLLTVGLLYGAGWQLYQLLARNRGGSRSCEA